MIVSIIVIHVTYDIPVVQMGLDGQGLVEELFEVDALRGVAHHQGLGGGVHTLIMHQKTVGDYMHKHKRHIKDT
jgi:hypothetical protein